VRPETNDLGGLHMLEQFKGFIGYTDEEFKELWEDALFVVDTNILINFYKYTSKDSTRSLLQILKKLKETNRLWIPHQVALEYFFNYEANMFLQAEGYDLLGKELTKLKDDATKILSQVKSKHPYIITENFNFFIKNIELSNNSLQEQLEKEMSNLPDSKAIHQELLNLLDGITGDPYSQARINEIEKDGKDRYQHDVPPGFKDKADNNKQSFRTYGDFKYQQLYGDLIVWYQIIDKVSGEGNSRPVILITEDRKEDWWQKDGQKIKRPHPQLIQEFLNKAKQKFYMYRTENFVENSMKYLEADVSEQQYQEVKEEIEHIRELENTIRKKISLKKNIAYGYLSDPETEFLNTTFVDPSPSNPRTRDWIYANAIPRMEIMLKERISVLKLINERMGNHAKRNFDNTPEEPSERAESLDLQITHVKDLIRILDAKDRNDMTTDNF